MALPDAYFSSYLKGQSNYGFPLAVIRCMQKL